MTANILAAYCFISNNYNFLSKKDEIILVGFSQGAFTVRCLASFISEVGLLRRIEVPYLRLFFQDWLQGKTESLQQKIKTFTDYIFTRM